MSERARCQACGSARLVWHAEADQLSIAHIDCDAFFAAVEKRDQPELANKPVIIGGGRRGVVSTCCYIARISGVRSAMPMFQALKRCPDAVVIKPNMERYSEVGAQVRQRMLELTPLVEAVSIDEAYLDLSGTERLHGQAPIDTLLWFASTIEMDLGITVSVGLSYGRTFAKLASEMNKPRGFSIIGRAEAPGFLKPKPISILPGVGAAMAGSLAKAGYHILGDLQAADEEAVFRKFGSHGVALRQRALGIDGRPISPERERKSVSSETTLSENDGDLERLAVRLRRQSERVARALKAKSLSARTVTLKLKTADFKTITRAQSLTSMTQSADRMYRTALPLLTKEANGRQFRLIGIGMSELGPASLADDRDLADAGMARRTQAEQAMDKLRERFGNDAVNVGQLLGEQRRSKPSADRTKDAERDGAASRER